MKIELTTAGGKFITLNLPKSPSDVPLRKFIDLDVGYNRLIEWVVGEEEEKSLYENRTYYAYKLAKLLSNYFERSEEHTSELQSRGHLVCRLLLDKKNKNKNTQQI